MGTFGSSKVAKNTTNVNNDSRQQNNSVAAQDSNVVSTAGGAYSVKIDNHQKGLTGGEVDTLLARNSAGAGLIAGEGFDAISSTIRAFLGQTADENSAAREANNANVGTLANALRTSATAGAEGSAAVAAASQSSSSALKIGIPVAVVGVVVLAFVLIRRKR